MIAVVIMFWQQFSGTNSIGKSILAKRSISTGNTDSSFRSLVDTAFASDTRIVAAIRFKRLLTSPPRLLCTPNLPDDRPQRFRLLYVRNRNLWHCKHLFTQSQQESFPMLIHRDPGQSRRYRNFPLHWYRPLRSQDEFGRRRFLDGCYDVYHWCRARHPPSRPIRRRREPGKHGYGRHDLLVRYRLQRILGTRAVGSY